MNTTTLKRPVGVTIIAVILFIQAAFGIIGGIAFLIERNDADFLAQISEESGDVTGLAIGLIIVGVITLLVAIGLWGGAGWARLLVAIVQMVHLAGGIYLLFAWGGTHIGSAVWQIAIALVVLAILYGARGDDFFEGRRTA